MARIAQVHGEHRADITRFRRLVLTLLAELEAQTDQPELFERLADLVNKGDDADDNGRSRARRLSEAYQRAMSVAGRTKTLKDLADALKTLIALEREAYGMGVDRPPPFDSSASVDPIDGARRLAFILSRGAARTAGDSSSTKGGTS